MLKSFRQKWWTAAFWIRPGRWFTERARPVTMGGGSSSEPQDVNVDVTVDIPLDDTNGRLSDIGDVITQQSEHIEDLTKLIKK